MRRAVSAERARGSLELEELRGVLTALLSFPTYPGLASFGATVLRGTPDADCKSRTTDMKTGVLRIVVRLFGETKLAAVSW